MATSFGAADKDAARRTFLGEVYDAHAFDASQAIVANVLPTLAPDGRFKKEPLHNLVHDRSSSASG